MKNIKLGFTHDNINNLSVDWYTPKWIFDELKLQFDLDPCHPIEKINWIPVKKTYNINDNGLIQKWEGNIWLNPPYGKETKTWLEKMHQHKNGVALLFSRTDCKWFHDYISKSDAILFLKGRIKFVDGLGKTGNSGAGSGSMLVAWGNDNVKALVNMKKFGYLIINDKNENNINNIENFF